MALLKLKSFYTVKVSALLVLASLAASASVSAGTITSGGDEQASFNVAFAAQIETAHMQAEYFSAEILGASVPDLEMGGYYLQLGWVLAGEQCRYKTSAGSVDKIKPESAGGACEVFARYDPLDHSGALSVRFLTQQVPLP